MCSTDVTTQYQYWQVIAKSYCQQQWDDRPSFVYPYFDNVPTEGLSQYGMLFSSKAATMRADINQASVDILIIEYPEGSRCVRREWFGYSTTSPNYP